MNENSEETADVVSENSELETVETNQEEVIENNEGQVTEGGEQASEQLPDGAKEEDPYGVKKRFAAFARQRDEMQRELELQRRQAHELQEQIRKLTAEPPKSRDDFIDDADYISYVADQRAREQLGAYQKQQLEQQQAFQTQQNAVKQWNDKISFYNEEIPDYSEVVGQATDVYLPPAAKEVILESDIGPKIAYYLAKNPDEAAKLSGMNERQLDRHMMKLELKLENETFKKKEKITNAPSMPKPKGTQPSGGDESIDRWIEKRRSARYGR